jgi:hypothetical protein
VYVMYWSLPLSNLLLFIKAWKFIGDRNDIFRWCVLEPLSCWQLSYTLLPRHCSRCLSALSHTLQVPVPREGIWHQSTQVWQAGAVQGRCLHVPGEQQLQLEKTISCSPVC